MEILKKIEKLDADILEIELHSSNKLTAYFEVIRYCKNLLEELYDMIIQDGFTNTPSEILFFKKIKPKVLSGIIYYTRLYKFELNYARLSERSKKKYVRKQRKRIELFYHSHSQFVQYTALKLKYFDEHYFTQKQLDKLGLICNRHVVQTDPISSYYDLILSKIIAFQKFDEYLSNHRNIGFNQNSISKSKLKWTSSKVALTELIYALHSSKVINSGSADIKEIAKCFQAMFSIHLGDFYRTYTEIKSRKKSRTKFIDELSIKLISRLDIEDSI